VSLSVCFCEVRCSRAVGQQRRIPDVQVCASGQSRAVSMAGLSSRTMIESKLLENVDLAIGSSSSG
jgi:hypothetical protein